MKDDFELQRNEELKQSISKDLKVKTVKCELYSTILSSCKLVKSKRKQLTKMPDGPYTCLTNKQRNPSFKLLRKNITTPLKGLQITRTV